MTLFRSYNKGAAAEKILQLRLYYSVSFFSLRPGFVPDIAFDLLSEKSQNIKAAVPSVL